jgi:hypothetical protein
MEQKKNMEKPERTNAIFLYIVFTLGFIMVIFSKYFPGYYLMFAGTYILGFGLLFLLYLLIAMKIEDGIKNEKNKKDN